MQSRLSSLIEAWSGTAVGFVINVLLGPLVYPFFGATFTWAQNIGIVTFFTVVSVLRGYAVRRFFNRRQLQSLRDISFD